MFGFEKITNDSIERGRLYAAGAMGKVAVLGEAITDMPKTYRETNSITASAATAAAALLSQYRHRKYGENATESQNLPGGQELLPPS